MAKAKIHQHANGNKWKYKTATGNLGSWTTTQPSETTLGINNETDSNFRLVRRIDRKIYNGGNYVKLQKFKYDKTGAPKEVVTTYHKPVSGWNPLGSANGAHQTSFDHGSAVQKNKTEQWSSAHMDQLSEIIDTGCWMVDIMVAGYGGSVDHNDDTTGITGGDSDDFDTTLLNPLA